MPFLAIVYRKDVFQRGCEGMENYGVLSLLPVAVVIVTGRCGDGGGGGGGGGGRGGEMGDGRGGSRAG